MKHTPGPWEITVSDYDRYGIHQVGMEGMAIIWLNKQYNDMDLANAHLIAAAPELLEACEAVYNSVTDEPSTIPGPAFAKVMNAIAKARGER